MDNMFVNESEMEVGRSRKGYIEHTDVVEYYNIAYLLGEHLYMYIISPVLIIWPKHKVTIILANHVTILSIHNYWFAYEPTVNDNKTHGCTTYVSYCLTW